MKIAYVKRLLNDVWNSGINQLQIDKSIQIASITNR